MAANWLPPATSAWIPNGAVLAARAVRCIGFGIAALDYEAGGIECDPLFWQTEANIQQRNGGLDDNIAVWVVESVGEGHDGSTALRPGEHDWVVCCVAVDHAQWMRLTCRARNW
jgi:hypothetical protein